jgi:hypothetical protein
MALQHRAMRAVFDRLQKRQEVTEVAPVADLQLACRLGRRSSEFDAKLMTPAFVSL